MSALNVERVAALLRASGHSPRETAAALLALLTDNCAPAAAPLVRAIAQLLATDPSNADALLARVARLVRASAAHLRALLDHADLDLQVRRSTLPLANSHHFFFPFFAFFFFFRCASRPC